MKKQIAVIFLMASSVVHAVPFVDAIRSHDVNFIPTDWMKNKTQVSLLTAFGVSGKGYNSAGKSVADPQYLYADQNALAMVKGALTGSEAANIAQQINVNGDDGVRGHYVVTGDFKVPANFVLSGHYHFLKECTVSAYLPFYSMEFKNTQWENQTKNVTGDDALTRTLLTDSFFSNVDRLGDGLNLQDWTKRGFGDLTIELSWMRRFLQHKEWLKEVGIRVRGGLSIPTGVKKDEDKTFSLAFGNDGAYAFPFGAGIDLRFKNYLKAGVDVAFEHVFSHRKVRRIMTDADQTNYLLLTKTDARKEYGITQMFNLYLEPQLPKGFSVRFAYQHTKHNEDELFVISNDYSSLTANKIDTLKEWTTHHIITQLKWDRFKVNEAARWQPQCSVFAKVPFNGKRSLQTASIGFSFNFGF